MAVLYEPNHFDPTSNTIRSLKAEFSLKDDEYAERFQELYISVQDLSTKMKALNKANIELRKQLAAKPQIEKEKDYYDGWDPV